MQYRGEEIIFIAGPWGVVVSAIVYTAAAWVIVFLFRVIFVVPFQLWKSEQDARVKAEQAVTETLRRKALIDELLRDFWNTHDNKQPEMAKLRLQDEPYINQRLAEAGEQWRFDGKTGKPV